MDKQDTEIKRDFIKTIFEHNQGLIELADSKANIIIGINSILIPLLFGVTGLNFILCQSYFSPFVQMLPLLNYYEILIK
ncbi:MAG TPA: hypothetical protein VMV32_00360 [Ignavibacteriaceae bacterium]|nr:hypothetical protein [Ignavibacteriaceae bacterium]